MWIKKALRLAGHSCFFATVALISFCNNALSNPLEDFRAKRYAYFAEHNVLALFPPRSERPGEVYIEPDGAFLYRWDDCFGDLTAYEFPTNLPSLIEVDRSELQTQGSIVAVEMAKAEADYSLHFSDIVEIAFNQPTIKGFSTSQIHDALSETPDIPCHAEILTILQRDARGQRDVPWIIQEVWYASERVSFMTRQNIAADVQGEIKDQVRRVGGGLGVSFENAGEGMVAVVSSDPFPVAWRPAYISTEHYQMMKDAEARGLFGRFLEWMGAVDSPREILLQLKEDFPDVVVLPSEITSRMSAGEPMEFDLKNEEHLRYLGELDLLFAISWEIYRET